MTTFGDRERDFDHLLVQGDDFTRDAFAAIRADGLAITAACAASTGRAASVAGRPVDAAPRLTRRAIDHGPRGLVLRRTRGRGDDAPRQIGRRVSWRQRNTAPKPDDYGLWAATFIVAFEGRHGRLLVDTTWAPSDWAIPLEFAKTAFPDDTRLAIPAAALQAGLWIDSDAVVESRDYRLGFCVDGNAYARRLEDGASLRFASHGKAARWLGKTSASLFGSALAAEQDRRFRALFANRRENGVGVVDASPPEAFDAGRHPCRYTFDGKVAKMIRIEDRFAQMRDANDTTPHPWKDIEGHRR